MKQRPFPSNPVLIVDDEINILNTFKLILGAGKINNIIMLQDAREVMPLLAKTHVETILLDINMPHIPGDTLLESISSTYPEIPVIMVTGNDEVDMAVGCIKTGAFDYMVKPIEKSRLISGVKRAIEIKQLNDENRLLTRQMYSNKLKRPEVFADIITDNKAMTTLFQYVESVANSPHPILITGETGTGKELMARAIHLLSCENGPFVSVNVAGIDDNVFSDTLFGHVKGAYTSADMKRSGLIKKAAQGTLCLDEIGDLTPGSQVKLLRLLQEHEYFPLGADIPQIMDVRIIASTNCDVKSMQTSGRFRKDLFYRLSAHHVHLPPLRQRRDDLPLLLDYFLEKAAGTLKKKPPAFPIELITLLSNYHFPGNIRELKGMVFDAVYNHKSKKLTMESFKNHIKQNQTSAPPEGLEHSGFLDFTTLPTMADAQYMLMKEALKRTGNNKSMAAEMLGISRQRLARHLKDKP